MRIPSSRIYTAGPDNSPIASQANAKPTYRLFSPGPNNSANVTILISLLRTTTSNEQIFAEECDVSSVFTGLHTLFLYPLSHRTRPENRAIIFAHEYHQIGSLFLRMDKEKERNAGLLATFLITTLLLPALLVAPVGRDIRIIQRHQPILCSRRYPPTSFRSPKRKVYFPERRHPFSMKHHRYTTSLTYIRRTPSCTIA